ncbi:MAG: (1-_4)-alpha-D-glucan 1-alpha-D-glucosylmutase, partial [Actinomycetota bacterium]|nr:(1->4)-alpha-D-glucan 1-alpha-D-glucosylmutase [Actinomycetota bacterium]
AFARRLEDRWALAVVPRLTTRVTRPRRFPIGKVWSDTTIVLPEGIPSEWRDVLCDVTVSTRAAKLPVGDALRHLPVALLVGVTARS